MRCKVYTCFVDLSKAYDSVDRHLAWSYMRARDLLAKYCHLLHS